jgi:hypothetical protein
VRDDPAFVVMTDSSSARISMTTSRLPITAPPPTIAATTPSPATMSSCTSRSTPNG